MKTISAETEGRRAIGYVRVASILEADPSSVREAQAACIKAFAIAEGFELIGIIYDNGKSALNMAREGLNEALSAAAGPGGRRGDRSRLGPTRMRAR